MAIPQPIRQHLGQAGVPYHILSHDPTETLQQAALASGIDSAHLARAVLLIDGKGLLLAILPANHLLDFSALAAQIGRELEPVSAEQARAVFQGCEPGSYPPVGAAYDVEEILDTALCSLDQVFFEPGRHDCLIAMTGADFRALHGGARTAAISRPVTELQTPGAAGLGADQTLQQITSQYTPAGVRRYIEEFHELPAMPATAGSILRLHGNPNASAADLARVVEQDPSLAAQVIRYASSPYYGYRGKLTSIQEAISRVLGFDMVMNMAMGIAIGRSFRIPSEGPLGLQAFWRHAVYCATLSEQLAKAMPREIRPRVGTAYLAGLLHNIGQLLLGHVFQAEYFLVNRYLAANPETPLAALERHVLGVSHDQIGGWLMQTWGMPDELGVVVRHHHDEQYWGNHALYAQLVLIANRLLRQRGIGDAETGELPAASLEILELTTEQVQAVAERVLKDAEGLDVMAQQLAA